MPWYFALLARFEDWRDARRALTRTRRSGGEPLILTERLSDGTVTARAGDVLFRRALEAAGRVELPSFPDRAVRHP